MAKHFTKILDLTAKEARQVLLRAKEMKETSYRGNILDDKILILIFEKASTRTRVSFQVAVRHLGGTTIFMTPADSQLGRAEPLRDTARVLSQYADGLIVRTFGQSRLDELMEFGSIPVINALTTEGHPCQVMSDILTMYERTPNLEDQVVAWVGDGNNMANSWIEAAIVYGFTLNVACPEGYDPDPKLIALAKERGAKVHITRDPQEAVKGANYINTDVWASMGQEDEQKQREDAFAGYMVDGFLMGNAAPEAKFMHCLPSHRGEEVSEDVFESPASIVFEQAGNRLHMQKAILEWIYAA